MQNSPIPLNHIYFDFDSHKLLSESIEELNKVVNVLKSDQRIIIEIVGHSDSIGDGTYNMNLSLRRAEDVCKYLLDNGVPNNQLIIAGYGNKDLLVHTTDTTSSARNRRVEFKIINLGE